MVLAADSIAETSDDPSRLCVECGLCCNGALFTHAKLLPEEVACAPTPVIQREETPTFSLPCPLLTDAGCSIYTDRFAICHSFRCALLKKLIAGEVGIDDALGTVGEAKRLIAGLTAVFPSGATIAGRLRAGGPAPQSTSVPTDAHGTAQARVLNIAVDLYLDRHFRSKNTRFTQETMSG